MPTPKTGESRKEFISRFMGNAEALQDYPDQEQRYVVALGMWKSGQKKETGDMQMSDSVSVSGFRRTADGYLAGEARVARTGVQVYLGREVGMADRDTVRIYRPAEEIFKAESLATYAHRPVTMGHPPNMVDSKSWKKTAVGQTGEEVLVDGQAIRVPLVLMDEAAITSVESGGSRELSMGYTCELEFVDGVTPEGEPYDAIQRNLRMNHLAVVPMARGGSTLRIGDNNEKELDMADQAIKTRTVLVDGLQVETTDAGAAAIDKLLKQLTDAQADHQKFVTDHQSELAKRDAEIDSLKAKVVTDAEIDARVKSRADLISKAKTLAPSVVVDGLSEAEIRRSVVSAKLGDAAIAGKPDAYIDARFDILVEDASTTDPVKSVLQDGTMTPVLSADAAYAANVVEMQQAWKKGAN